MYQYSLRQWYRIRFLLYMLESYKGACHSKSIYTTQVFIMPIKNVSLSNTYVVLSPGAQKLILLPSNTALMWPNFDRLVIIFTFLMTKCMCIFVMIWPTLMDLFSFFTLSPWPSIHVCLYITPCWCEISVLSGQRIYTSTYTIMVQCSVTRQKQCSADYPCKETDLMTWVSRDNIYPICI